MTALKRERLRRQYRPRQVRILFVGEAPPASGLFFYQANSGLYRAIRDAFAVGVPETRNGDFLENFKALGCYLVDLCGIPVDRFAKKTRRRICVESELGLSRIVKNLHPAIVITVMQSIVPNITRSLERAGWIGKRLDLPYPGRWRRHRARFLRMLIPVLRENLGKRIIRQVSAAQSGWPSTRPKA